MRGRWIQVILLGVSLACSAQASIERSPTLRDKPLAYVYDGPGACDGCATDLIRALKRSGLQAKAISPAALSQLRHSALALFAIPGGDPEQKVIEALGPAGIRWIRQFVAQGGRYLGVCLGAFVAAPRLANAPALEGLALFDGVIANHSPTPEPRIEKVNWQGREHSFYFQDGPQFNPAPSFRGELWAHFADGSVAALQTGYGRGKVGLISIHPEATDEWLQEDHLTDPDGTDLPFFRQFVRALLE
jgi:glutamine amidotransferase-like uncharacterized protein